MNIDVIIPCYNEENTIEKIILESIKHLSSKDNLIIVDDGSTDKSNFIIRKLENKFSNINLVKHEKNLGKGAAIQTALKRVQNEIVIIQDSDLEYNPSEYKKLINPLLKLKADVVYGSRFKGSDAQRVLYFWHRMGNGFLTFFSNMMTNLNLTDTFTCYKAFNREILKNIEIKENRFGFDAEITAKLAKKKARFFEVGISYYGRTYEEGKKINWKDGFRVIYSIIKYNLL